MSKGLVFWLLMVIWFFFGLWSNRAEIKGGNFSVAGGGLLLFALMFLLGWAVFGFVIQ